MDKPAVRKPLVVRAQIACATEPAAVEKRLRGRPRKTLGERDDGNRRVELVNAAARLFRRKGFGATSTRDMAGAVGMHSGSPFYHFKSKGALLYAVMDEGIATRDLEREIIPTVLDQRLGLMVWSPLAGGLLSGKFTRTAAGPGESRRVAFDFPPVNKEHAFGIVDVLRPMAEERGTSVARLALAWLLHQKAVMSVIVGVKTVAQLDENLAASGLDAARRRTGADRPGQRNGTRVSGWMIERMNSDPRPGVQR